MPGAYFYAMRVECRGCLLSVVERQLVDALPSLATVAFKGRFGRVGAPHHRDVRGEAKSESPPMKHVPRCRCVCHRSSESRHVVLRIYCHSRSIEGLTGVLCYDNFEDNLEKWRRRSRMNAGLPVTNILCRNKGSKAGSGDGCLALLGLPVRTG